MAARVPVVIGANNNIRKCAGGDTIDATYLPASALTTVATDTIFDAKGDLPVGTGSDTAAKLTVGANDTFLVADSGQSTGLKWANAATSRTALGLATGDSPQFTAVNIGDAADTTLSRSSAGNLAVEGNLIYRAGGTDVPVADGGTGGSTPAEASINLGFGRSLFSRNADASNATGAESTIYSDTIAANTFANNTSWIEFKYWGVFASNADDKYISVKWDTGNYLYDSSDIAVISLNGVHWDLTGTISRVSNTVLRCNATLSAYSLPSGSWTRSREVTSLNLSSTAYNLLLRGAGDDASEVTARGGWARFYTM